MYTDLNIDIQDNLWFFKVTTWYLGEYDKLQENKLNHYYFIRAPFIVIIMQRMANDSMNVGIIVMIFTFKYQFNF